MARTHKGGYELLLFLKEKRISLQAAKEIIADAEAAINKWKAEKREPVVAGNRTR